VPGAPLTSLVVAVLLAVAPMRVAATLVPGGGSRRTDCMLQMSAEGVGFPARKTPKGVSCADGDVCDLDGQRNGVCVFQVSLCLNQPTRACQPRPVKRATVKAKQKSVIDVTSLQAALAAIPLPTSDTVCSAPALISVPTRGPGGHGRVRSRKVALKASATAGSRKDSDTYRLTCVPTTVGGGPTATATTTPVGSTTTTTTPISIPPAAPGAGLVSQITAATVSAEGVVTITFILTDTAGTALIPSTASTDDPAQARVRFTIAHLDVDTATTEGQTTTFTRYRNYIVPNPGQPGYDSGGSLGALDQAHGIYTYTFATMLPPGFPATVTHTVGGQVDRSVGAQTLRANPLFDFVPAGGAVTTIRQVATTAECNGCHQPLAEHGGGRREVGLCQLCHTDQGFDETGTSIELQQMIHRIHRGASRGNELPSIVDGALGATYQVGGTVFAEKVSACAGGALDGVPCSSDGDCPNGTCTGTTVTGVGFPQDIRSCAVCHSKGATAGDYLTKASTSACTGCHDDVNPSEIPTTGIPKLAPGMNHVAGAQPEAFCSTLCHVPTAQREFDISVPGAHTVPERSTQLKGFVGELLSATGSPGGAVTVTFRLKNGDGTVLTTVTGLSTLALAISGPSSDFDGLTKPVTISMLSTSGGTLTGPDGSGVFTFTTTVPNGVPAAGMGTWRVGMEARRSVPIVTDPGPPPVTANVNEAIQNVVRDFSVDGSPVVPRRSVVDQAKCASCHGVFSQGFSIHGNLRNRVEYCVVCHNPSNSDFARRVGVTGADPNTQPIGLKHMLHKIHTGDELTQQPYVIYGFSGSVNNFGDVLFPGNRANCEGCHLPETFLLPLPPGVLPTQLTMNVSGVNTTVGSIPPIQDACLTCHDDAATAAHAATNTAGTAEACPVCHGETGIEPVSVVHANALL
jgi:OmcA/MtrC family decaheme c-type cytochrome